MRRYVLQKLYRLFPFSLRGDASFNAPVSCRLSCIIPTFRRPADLQNILCSLAAQDLNGNQFEVIVVEDESLPANRHIIDSYQTKLRITHLTRKTSVNNVAQLRNEGLSVSTGEIVLFLDDDTILRQSVFLSTLLSLFNGSADAVLIPGECSVSLWPERYGYIDRYSFATRCVAYSRAVLEQLGGFLGELTSYEDAELSIRFSIIGGRAKKASHLIYSHPPFYYHNWKKPLSSGLAFLKLKGRYSFPVWILCYMNALRFLPFLFFPVRHLRQWGKISGGFLAAPIFQYVCRDKKIVYR